MQSFLRMVATCLVFAPIACGESSPPLRPPGMVLAVSVTVPEDNVSLETLDTRDLEHAVVSKLKRNRISAIAFTSIEETLESDEGIFVIDIGIDQADIAQRPQWNWTDQRFRDQEILHLELSLTVTRIEDGESLGYLYRSYDYKAEDYGPFASSTAIRGAVYESIASLSSAFVAGVERGDFGSDLDSFRHPFTLEDAPEVWRDMSTGFKAALVFAAALLLLLIAATAYRVTGGIARLLGLNSTEAYVVVRDKCPLRSQSTPAVLRAQMSPEQEAEEDAEDDE